MSDKATEKPRSQSEEEAKENMEGSFVLINADKRTQTGLTHTTIGSIEQVTRTSTMEQNEDTVDLNSAKMTMNKPLAQLEKELATMPLNHLKGLWFQTQQARGSSEPWTQGKAAESNYLALLSRLNELDKNVYPDDSAKGDGDPKEMPTDESRGEWGRE